MVAFSPLNTSNRSSAMSLWREGFYCRIVTEGLGETHKDVAGSRVFSEPCLWHGWLDKHDPHSQSLQPLLDCLIVETVLLTIHPASQIPPCGGHSWFCQRFLPGNLSLHSFPHPTPRDSDFNKLRILNLKQVTLVNESLDGDSKLVLGEARVHGVPPWLIEGLAGEFKLYL